MMLDDPLLSLPLPPSSLADDAAAFASSFATAVVHAHRAQGGVIDDIDVIHEAARQACMAVQQGHAAADLALLADDEVAIDLLALRRSPVVGNGQRVTPLVLQGSLLYLYRYWRYERRLALRLTALNRRIDAVDPQQVRRVVDALFSSDQMVTPNWQKVAVATALMRQLCVISGGPGTGKTTTVVRILAGALRLQPPSPPRCGLRWRRRPARRRRVCKRRSRRSCSVSRWSPRCVRCCRRRPTRCTGCSACGQVASAFAMTRAIRCPTTWWSSTKRR